MHVTCRICSVLHQNKYSEGGSVFYFKSSTKKMQQAEHMAQLTISQQNCKNLCHCNTSVRYTLQLYILLGWIHKTGTRPQMICHKQSLYKSVSQIHNVLRCQTICTKLSEKNYKLSFYSSIEKKFSYIFISNLRDNNQ